MGEKVQSVLQPGDHGSTYGGNPVACAGAVSVIERMDEEFLSQVRQRSEYVFSTLRGAKGINGVSGMGLMVGIETVAPAADIVKECINRGVLCLTAKNKVRLLPALNIPMEQLKKAAEIILAACAQ
jgi:acetylornithine/N-succinyldiaminopimelate aminotransferase